MKLLRRSPEPPLVLPDLTGSHAVAVCHPEWRGVRAAAHSFGVPVVESAALDVHANQIFDAMEQADVGLLVVHGWPPGAAGLLRRAAERGVTTRAVVHSSPAQHGAEVGEAQVIDDVLDAATGGLVGRVGVVKAGFAPALQALGFDVAHVPNRTPVVGEPTRVDLGGDRLHVGVFGEPFWRKNVVTQLAAVALLDGAQAHTLEPPPVGYLRALPTRSHGVLPRSEFLDLQASVDLTLYVTLSECHPLTPIESYLLGVPCLTSRTSEVFADDADLWQVTTVDRADDPSAIATAAERLLSESDTAVAAAGAWIERADARAAAAWDAFLSD